MVLNTTECMVYVKPERPYGKAQRVWLDPTRGDRVLGPRHCAYCCQCNNIIIITFNNADTPQKL